MTVQDVFEKLPWGDTLNGESAIFYVLLHFIPIVPGRKFQGGRAPAFSCCVWWWCFGAAGAGVLSCFCGYDVHCQLFFCQLLNPLSMSHKSSHKYDYPTVSQTKLSAAPLSATRLLSTTEIARVIFPGSWDLIPGCLTMKSLDFWDGIPFEAFNIFSACHWGEAGTMKNVREQKPT